MHVNCPIGWRHRKRRSLRNPQRPVILVAASNGAQPLLSCSAGGSRDPARGRGRTDDLGPCRPGPTPAEPLRGGASVEIAQGKGNPEGNRRRTGTGQRPKGTNRRTPDQGEPREGGRRGRTRRANGKPEESPPRETGGREVRPQTTRARARGSGAARICGGASSWRGARPAHSRPPAPWRATQSGSRTPCATLPLERRQASSAVC
jgi:hypothetical protein